MKKEKIENIVYIIIVAVTCSLYFLFGAGVLALVFPFEILSDDFTVLNCIVSIFVVYPLGAWFIGSCIMATCVVVCEIPLSIFHFNTPRDKATDDAFDRIFRYSIIGAVIVMVLSLFYIPLFFDKSDEQISDKPSYEYGSNASSENTYAAGGASGDDLEELEEYLEKHHEEYGATDSGFADEDLPEISFGTIEESPEEESPSTEEETSEEDAAAEETEEETVYITPTGSKYHREKCGNGTYYPIDKQEAIDKGYEPCSKCW